MWRSVGVSVFALGSFVVGGCGDDDKPRLTQEEFVTQGNAVCSAGNAQADELFADLPPDREPTPEELATIFPKLIDGLKDQIDGIDALNPPTDLQDEVDDLVKAARAALSVLEDAGPEGLFTENEDPFEDGKGKYDRDKPARLVPRENMSIAASRVIEQITKDFLGLFARVEAP